METLSKYICHAAIYGAFVVILYLLGFQNGA